MVCVCTFVCVCRYSVIYVLCITYNSRQSRFAGVLENKNAALDAVTLPRFKLCWLQSQDRTAIEDELFSYEDDTSATAEGQLCNYFKSRAQRMDTLNGLPLISISLKYNAATPSSVPYRDCLVWESLTLLHILRL